MDKPLVTSNIEPPKKEKTRAIPRSSALDALMVAQNEPTKPSKPKPLAMLTQPNLEHINSPNWLVD